ncbi:MAG: alpha/beta hydrolase [Sandaracinaceae bacterium]|nr:alpha/beta hydrolase [Sandaracinaceae bacterium]
MRLREIVGEGERDIVFLHGMPGDGSLRDDVVGLAPRGVRCMVVDMPDIGYDAPGTSLDELERAFAGLCARLDRPTSLVGTSGSAWLVARALASGAAAPEKAVLRGGFAQLPASFAAARAQLADALSSGAVGRSDAFGGLMDAALAEASTPRAREALDAMLSRIPDDRLVRTLRLVASMAAPDRHVGPYSTPAVVVHCEADVVVPFALGRELAGLGSRASLLTWPGGSHMTPVTYVRQVADLVYA